MFAVRVSVRENHLDLEQLATRGVTPQSVAESLSRDDAHVLVSEDEEGVCGFVIADASSASVSALFVGPEAEGRGHGRALLSAAEKWLGSRGLQKIELQTGHEEGNRAHAFYRAAGWVMTGPADHGDVSYEKRVSVP